jgi:hypothetical protein
MEQNDNDRICAIRGDSMRKTITTALVLFIGSAFLPALHGQTSKGFNPGPFYVRPPRITGPLKRDFQFMVALRPEPFANLRERIPQLPPAFRNKNAPQKISPIIIAPNPGKIYK